MRLVYEHLTDIPLNFTEVEYLQSSGTQYIDTGIQGSSLLKIEIEAEQVGSSDGGVFGCGADPSSADRIQGYWSNGRASIRIDGTVYDSSSAPQSNKPVLFLLDILNKKGYINGAQYISTFSGSISNRNLWLFGRNTGGADSVKFNSSKFYYTKIWDNNVLVRDFVPCLDNNNVPCMYDKVEGKAYYNAGSGSFTYGRQVIPVEYLESTGTQYIDTGVNADSNLGIETLAQLSTTTNDQYMGALKQNGSSYLRHHLTITAGGVYAYHLYQTRYDFTKDTNKHYIAYNAQEHKLFFDDTVQNTSSDSFDTGLNYWLFKLNNNAGLTFNFSIRLFYFKMYSNGVVARDFVPCKDENNIGFMFDRVTHTAYLNAGTGSFITGSVKPKNKLRLIRESKRRLPKGFKEVVYLQSSGTQYINTGLAPNANQKIELRGFKAGGGSTSGCYIACGSTATANDRIQIWAEGGGLAWFRVDGASLATNESCTVNHKFVLDIKNKKGYVDSSEYNLSYSGSLTTYPYFLFLRNNGGTPDTTYNAPMRLYYVKIWDNDSLVRDLIPCLDASNVPCMYDLVEGKAYYNAGTGSFTYGHTITPVEYLQSSGTQYIDTGVKGKSWLSAYIDCEYTSLTETSISMLDARDANNRIYLCHVGKPSTTYYFYYGYGSAIQSNTIPTTNTRYKVETNLSVGSQSMNVNGTQIVTGASSTSYSLNYNLYLFGNNSSGSATFLAKAKLYSCKISEGSSLVRDYIPVKDENNVGYMFDKVTHSLYANAGSGAFVVGNEIKQDITRFVKDDVPNIYQKVSYLQSSGTQYIDTGYKPNNTSGLLITGMSISNANQVWIGSRDDSGDTRWDLGTNIITYNCVHYGWNTPVNTQKTITTNQIVTASLNYKNDRKFICGNVVENITGTLSPTQHTQTAYLFTWNIAGSPSYNHAKEMRMYNCVITEGSAIVRDFYPALRKSDNKPGMYDRVTKQFFTNAGTGEFTYG